VIDVQPYTVDLRKHRTITCAVMITREIDSWVTRQMAEEQTAKALIRDVRRRLGIDVHPATITWTEREDATMNLVVITAKWRENPR
jgi:hypothetical protein